MKKGDRIIYDSGEGYSVGYFVKYIEDSIHAVVQLDTKFLTTIYTAKTTLRPYTEEAVADLTEEYGYEVTFTTSNSV